MTNDPNAISFEISLRRQARELTREEVNTFVRRIAMLALIRIVRRNPIDTGFSRGNWQVSLDEPPPQTTQRRFGAEVSISEGVLRILNFDIEKNSRIFLGNSVSYIHFLERGSSGQAPQGMVAITVAELDGVQVA